MNSIKTLSRSPPAPGLQCSTSCHVVAAPTLIQRRYTHFKFDFQTHDELRGLHEHRTRMPAPCSGKGFDPNVNKQTVPAGTSNSNSATDSVEAIEDRLRGSQKRKVEAKVKVNAPAVDAATGKTAPTPEAEFETKAVAVLLALFIAIMAEGLALAASGFLPEGQDAWIAQFIYPAFSPTVLVFLGASSLYGLWKTGKLPGQRQL